MKKTMIITVTCTIEAAVKLKHEKKKSQGDQFPDGLITQLIEHCTSTTEVMGLNPVHV